ncbi:MAG: glycosyltransferase [Verrucomicrobia bacterium]|nr:glycosyltransferase [Verrucomicrobiota bacterium]
MQKITMNNVRDAENHGALSDSSGPTISVVVATFNRRESLRRLLESLAKQTFSADQFEVIVVSDGSTDWTVDMLRELKGGFRNLEILDLKNRGPGAARNAGARLARGKYLAFTDDDCLAAPDWLEQLVRAFECTGAVGLQGQTTTDRLARTPLTHQIEILKPCLTSMPTCNAAYLKSAFDKVGGFDESFKFAHDEDADLAWRVEDLGKMVFVPEVHIIHPPRRDKLMKRARWVRGLESEFLLYHKSPEKYRKYVKSPSPWWTIYWKVFVVGQLQWAKSCCKYLLKPFRPDLFIVGITLVVARWFNLIRFLPSYWNAQSVYRTKFSKSQI